MCRCISFLPAVGQRSRAHRSDALPPQKGKPFNTLDHSSYSNKIENGGGNFSILKSIKRRNKKKEKKKMGNLVARFAHSGGGPVSFHKFIGGAPPRMKREREKNREWNKKRQQTRFTFSRTIYERRGRPRVFHRPLLLYLSYTWFFSLSIERSVSPGACSTSRRRLSPAFASALLFFFLSQIDGCRSFVVKTGSHLASR